MLLNAQVCGGAIVKKCAMLRRLLKDFQRANRRNFEEMGSTMHFSSFRTKNLWMA